jgi:DNA-binding winged helix-turn-helix (wHTH) protein
MPNPNPHPVLAFGDFELDEANFQLRRNGKIVEIRPKELEVLIFVIRRRPHLVRWDELERAVWPDVKIVSPETRRQALKALRDRLDADPDRWITTIRGIGCHFVDEVREVLPASSGGDAAPSASMFVDRDDEMGQLMRALAYARAQTFRLVVLHGPPGIGKTRTARQLGGKAREVGFDVHEGRAHESGGARSYRPWAEIFRSLCRTRGEAALRAAAGSSVGCLAALVPELAAVPADLAPEADRDRFFDVAVTVLETLAKQQPLLLILDDLHWADEDSLSLLAFITENLIQVPLMIVGTHRELDRFFEGRRAQALARARRDLSAQSIPLRGLTPDSVSGILEGVLREAPSPLLVERVHRHTGGNPLFVALHARWLAERGRELLDESAALPIPDAAREMVWTWFSGRSEACRRLLELAAVAGPELSLAALQRTFRGARAELLDALDEAERCGFLVSEDSLCRRFSHGLFREALYAALDDRRRMEYHRDVGEAIEAIHGPEGSSRVPELAHHFVRAAPVAGGERAVRYSCKAAERALQDLAHEDAVAHYRRALAALDFVERPDASLRCSLLVELGLAMAAGPAEIADVQTVLTDAMAIARDLGLGRRFARAAIGMTSHALGKSDLAFFDPMKAAKLRASLAPALHEALEELAPGEDDSLRGRIFLLLARLVDPEKEPDRAGELIAQALRLAESAGDQTLQTRALLAECARVPTLDRAEERRQLSDRALELSRRIGNRELERMALGPKASLALERGDRAEAEAARAALHQLDAGYSVMAEWIRVQREGPLTEAGRIAGEVFARGRHLRFTGQRNQAVLGIQLWWLGIVQGEHAPRIHMLQQYVAARPQVLEGRMMLARLLAEAGDLVQARAHFELCNADVVERRIRDDQWLFVATTVAETAALLGDLAQGRRLFELLHPYRERIVTGSWSILCLGSAGRPLGTLAAALEEWDTASDLFELALARNDAIRAPVLTLWTELDWIRAWQRHPDSRERRLAQRALESLEPRAAALGMSGALLLRQQSVRSADGSRSENERR